MTVIVNTSRRGRTHPIREHAYRLPVVRELPQRPPDPVGARWLW
jgi:hypothetical protein